MRNWNDRLKKAFDESDYNKTRFAKAVGVSGATVTDWMSGEIKNMKATSAQRVCRVLGIEADWLISGKGPMRVGDTQESFVAAEFGIPLISWVQAGPYCESPDMFHPGDAEEWLPKPANTGDYVFALTVEGDSMTSPYPGQRSYPHGTIIYVDPEKAPVNGSRVVARANGSQTFKLYVEDAGKMYLKPINPTYDKIEIIDGTSICGVVIGSYLPE